jgi:shikimate kinase
MSDSGTIILIGAICAGKSTIAQMLSEQLKIPRYELDENRWRIYKEIGYDEQQASKVAKAEGITGIIRYWKPFEAYAVERVLATQSNCVIDFGAGHSVYEDQALFQRVEHALKPFPHVF